MSVLIAIFTLCCCLYLQELAQTIETRRLSQSLRSAAFEQTEEDLPAAAAQSEISWSELLQRNSDTVGWIRIEGTQTDNIVVQRADNEYYVDHDVNGKKSKYGTVFADMNCLLKDTPSQNITIYGHNMKDGQMFGELKNYRQLKFYQKYPLIEFHTTGGTKDIYKIFCVAIINAYPEQDDGYAFDYRRMSFESQDAFLQWAGECVSRSMIQAPVDIKANDQILTLSTCTYEFEQARLVIMARLTREGEPSAVDTSLARRNPDTVYPKAYVVARN